MTKKKLIVLTGAGISAESGIRTFRDSGGLWEEHDVTEVATPEAWDRDPQMVLHFYNDRRKQLIDAKPNKGHYGLAALEELFDVHIITQNVDDLHERAGSSKVLHLHGELKKSRSSAVPSLIYDIEGWEIKWGACCEKGSQLRPHIVWFGEPVPAMEEAASIASLADLFVVVGTSLNVYPAASLIHYTPQGIPVWLIDPADVPVPEGMNIEIIREGAGKGVETLTELLRRYI